MIFLIDAHTGEIIAEQDNVLENSAHPTPILAPVSTEQSPTFLQEEASHVTDDSAGEETSEVLTTAEPEGLVNTIYGYVKLNYYVTPDDYTGPLTRQVDKPFYNAKVTVKNNQTLQTYTTYALTNGYYEVAGLNSGSHTVTFEIANQKAKIGSGLTDSQKKKSFTVNVSGTVQQDYDWNWGVSGDGGLSSYALNSVYRVRQMYNYLRIPTATQGWTT